MTGKAQEEIPAGSCGRGGAQQRRGDPGASLLAPRTGFGAFTSRPRSLWLCRSSTLLTPQSIPGVSLRPLARGTPDLGI